MVDSDGWCFSHRPGIEDQRVEVRRKGGVHSSTLARIHNHLPQELADVVSTLAEVIVEVRNGQTSPATGNSIASLSRAVIAAHAAASEEARVQELESTLARLEELLPTRGLLVVT